ncbi:MAG: hypothetical protein N2C12_04380, partial [Planctomycetales bacterium]
MFGRFIFIWRINSNVDRRRVAAGRILLLFFLAALARPLHGEQIYIDPALELPDNSSWSIPCEESFELLSDDDECCICTTCPGEISVFSELIVWNVTEGGADNWSQ